MSSRTFVDRAQVFVRAGKGGDGVNSFHKDRLHRKAMPDGGEGGKGGDIVLRATGHLHTLLDFQYRRQFAAENGTHGSGNRKKGRQGKNCVIHVPVGTLVLENETGEVLADLVTPWQEIRIAPGGRGGKGNDHHSPATKGGAGEEKNLHLELKLLADVGLIGCPNAGKSTLLGAISGARPKIADYPFTTLVPQLGVAEWGETCFTVADIPGLIEGAHQGKGLGDDFLQHVERTAVLVFVLDVGATEGRDTYQDYQVLKQELEKYQETLLKKPSLIAANKMDLPTAKENLVRLKRRIREPIYPISAKEKTGMEELKGAIVKIL